MNYEEYKAKVFAEQPEVKEEYEALDEVYKAIVDRIVSMMNGQKKAEN